MGLFGSSPQKKLEKARDLFAAGRWFDSMRLYEDVIEAGAKVSESERSEARRGHRDCRERMLELRLREAEELRLAGDLESARDRCQTALDLVGDDLDPSDAQEALRRIDAPSRAVAAGPAVGEVHETDLLPEAGRRVVLQPTTVDRPAPEPEPRSDEELFGDNPEELFEVHLHGLSEPVADYLRSLGPDFRLGYLALVQGEGKRALDFFERLDWEAIRHPVAVRQRANALLLAGRAEEALALIDGMAPVPGVTFEPPDELDGEARRRYLRIDALRVLGRLEEAVEDARSLADSAATVEPSPLLEALLGWVLIEAGRPQDAFDRLSRLLQKIGYHEEILVPAAQAAVAIDRDDEAVSLLEQLIQMRMEHSLMRNAEIDFPVEAGRRLLEIHLRRGAEEPVLRTLILHLIDYDPQDGERYRGLLLQLDRWAEEKARAGEQDG